MIMQYLHQMGGIAEKVGLDGEKYILHLFRCVQRLTPSVEELGIFLVSMNIF